MADVTFRDTGTLTMIPDAWKFSAWSMPLGPTMGGDVRESLNYQVSSEHSSISILFWSLLFVGPKTIVSWHIWGFDYACGKATRQQPLHGNQVAPLLNVQRRGYNRSYRSRQYICASNISPSITLCMLHSLSINGTHHYGHFPPASAVSNWLSYTRTMDLTYLYS